MSGTLRQKLGKTMFNTAANTATRAAPAQGAVTHFSQQSKIAASFNIFRQWLDQQVAPQTQINI